jgi:hypothetical protein
MVELTKFHIKNIQKMAKKYEVDPKLIDIEANWDSSLTAEENYNNIKAILLSLSTNNKKLEENFQKDEVEHYEKIMMEEERRIIQEQIKKEFEEIMKSETSDLKKYYFCLEKFVETTLKANHIHSLFITGKAGIGKSFSVVKKLTELNCDYKIILGNISPLELFHTLYEYRNSNNVIVFDDTHGLLKNKQSMSLLMSAMWNPTNKRIVSWLTTSKKLKCPEQFEFRGKIIFIANELPEDIMPIVSRCLQFELSLSYWDILKIMAEISKQPHPSLTREERQMIFNWIKDNTDETTKDFDLRLQKKIETLYEYNKDNWQELAFKLINRDEDLAVIKQLVKEYTTTKTQVQKWIEITGKSRRWFFKKKKILEQSSYNLVNKVN